MDPAAPAPTGGATAPKAPVRKRSPKAPSGSAPTATPTPAPTPAAPAPAAPAPAGPPTGAPPASGSTPTTPPAGRGGTPPTTKKHHGRKLLITCVVIGVLALGARNNVQFGGGDSQPANPGGQRPVPTVTTTPGQQGQGTVPADVQFSAANLHFSIGDVVVNPGQPGSYVDVNVTIDNYGNVPIQAPTLALSRGMTPITIVKAVGATPGAGGAVVPDIPAQGEAVVTLRIPNPSGSDQLTLTMKAGNGMKMPTIIATCPREMAGGNSCTLLAK